MALASGITYQNTVFSSVGFNMSKAIALDSRLVLNTKEDLTKAYNGDNVAYAGMIVAVIKDTTANNNGIYELTALPNTTLSNWKKISTEAQLDSAIKNINVNVNGVQGTNENGVVSVSISGNSITLSNSYDGVVIQGIGNGAVAVSPVKGDTLDEAIKKLAKIIVDDEEVISASLNDLNDKVLAVSGSSVTNVGLDATKENIVVTKNGENINIPLTDLAKIYTFDTNGDEGHNVKLTATVSGNKILVQGNVDTLDCGIYTGTDA